MMKYSTYTWDLVHTIESASLPPPRHQPHLLSPTAKSISQKKAWNAEIRCNSQQIVLYCLGLRTHNPGLMEVDLEPSPTRGIEMINMLKQERPQKKKVVSYSLDLHMDPST